MNRKESGKIAKLEGHTFENSVCVYLSELLNDDFFVDGHSDTKVDIRNESDSFRFSVKNPKNRHTQVSLITQKNFIEYFNITDDNLKLFIKSFFGGDEFSDYTRHRLTKSNITEELNQLFLSFLNSNSEKLFDLIFTKGYKQRNTVNYLLWTQVKNSVNDLICVDLESFKNEFIATGKWIQNETTFHFMSNGKKLLHLQMFGSGEKYKSGYHSLQFQLYNSFDNKYVRQLNELEVKNGI